MPTLQDRTSFWRTGKLTNTNGGDWGLTSSECSTISRTKNVLVSGWGTPRYAPYQYSHMAKTLSSKLRDQRVHKMIDQTHDEPNEGSANITNL